MKSRKWLPILLTVWPYFVLGLLWIIGNQGENVLGPVITLLCVATAVIYVLNIVHASRHKNKDIRGLALAGMLIKLVHIPFYLIIFMLGVMALAVMVVPVFVFISPVIVIILAIIDFFLMLTSSAYGINALVGAQKQGIISKRFMIIHILMHLCFILDIISAIIVYIKLRKENG